MICYIHSAGAASSCQSLWRLSWLGFSSGGFSGKILDFLLSSLNFYNVSFLIIFQSFRHIIVLLEQLLFHHLVIFRLQCPPVIKGIHTCGVHRYQIALVASFYQLKFKIFGLTLQIYFWTPGFSYFSNVCFFLLISSDDPSVWDSATSICYVSSWSLSTSACYTGRA